MDHERNLRYCFKNFRWYDQQCTACNRSHDDFDLYVSFAIDNPAAEILETSQKMQPELNAIRDKYKNRKDQEAMMAMNQETQLVYQKYGISTIRKLYPDAYPDADSVCFVSCILYIPAYISCVRSSTPVFVDGIINTNGFVDKLTALMTNFNAVTSSGLNANNVADKLNAATGTTLSNYVTDIMYKLPSTAWEKTADAGKTIFEQFPNLSDSLNSTLHDMNQFNYFLGLNISDTPWAIIKSSIASHAWLLLIIAVIDSGFIFILHR